ncbi:MAG: S41 family peptidase [Candidatus Magasanikbacteria bacterium]
MSDHSPIKLRARKYAGIYLSVILFIVSFGLGVFAGQTWYVQKQVTNSQGNVEIAKLLNFNRTMSRSDSVDFDQFWEVWDKLKEKYVNSDSIKETDLFYGAIQGLVYGLGDPYSVYFPPQAANEFAKSLSGEFEGIGAEIGVKQNQLVIVAPLPNSPAEKAGLRPGDEILAIDKIDTTGMDSTAAVMKIRGQAGTNVILTIAKNGATKAQDITIARAKINIPAVWFSYKDLPGTETGARVAYLRVMQFNENTTDEFDSAIKKLKADGAKGLILDLRSNPGGYLDSAVEMASEWIKEGKIVSERFSSTTINVHETSGKHRLAGMKTVVLVNGGSASASEIVAGALQDTKSATIIGEKTFGKGSVQDFETFADGSALKLTVAEWLTPNGKNINDAGITPDVEVKEDYEKEAVGEDSMIEKALELLKSKE